jgi:hypothetical protein
MPPRFDELDIDQIPEQMFEKMGITREGFRKVRDDMQARDARTPAVGSSAPDFRIERLSEHGKRTGEMFELSSTRGRPVALVFGSYT